jgi:hypothetical protein
VYRYVDFLYIPVNCSLFFSLSLIGENSLTTTKFSQHRVKFDRNLCSFQSSSDHDDRYYWLVYCTVREYTVLMEKGKVSTTLENNHIFSLNNSTICIAANRVHLYVVSDLSRTVLMVVYFLFSYSDDLRTANIIADDESGVSCLVIDRETFNQLISNLDEIRTRYDDEGIERKRWAFYRNLFVRHTTVQRYKAWNDDDNYNEGMNNATVRATNW